MVLGGLSLFVLAGSAGVACSCCAGPRPGR